MDNQETVQAAIDSLRQDVEGLKTKLYLKETAMELLLANLAKTEQELAVMQQQMDDVLLGSIATFAMPVPPQGWLACDGQEVSRQTYARLFGKIGTTFGEGDGESTFNLPDLQGEFVRGWDGKREFGSFQDDQMQGHTHRDGGHSHQGSTNSEGSHEHEGEIDEDGSHGHYIAKRDNDTFSAIGFFEKYKMHKDEPKQHIIASVQERHIGQWTWSDKHSASITYTESSGSHSHDLEISSAGSHSHSFSTASASANLGLPSALSHGEPRCGSETRPRNVALLFCIKY